MVHDVRYTHQEDKRYNDEAIFLDGVIEFHRQAFIDLEKNDQAILKEYYGLEALPPNIFAYRRSILKQHPELEAKAKAALARLLKALGIEHFPYSNYTSAANLKK